MAVFRDTEEQLFAKTTDRHLSVTANAGSGKTTVLVDRYVNLISGKNKEMRLVEPKNIVAITFTKMAASEMTLKIIEKIKEKLDNATSKQEIQDLSLIRTKIGSAKISTIHSFCGNLLREFPIEAGVQPNFSEISDPERIRIKRTAYFDAITDRLNSNDEQIVRDTSRIVNILGAEELEEHIFKITDKFNSIDTFRGIYNSNFKDIQNIYKAELVTELSSIIKAIALSMKTIYSYMSFGDDSKQRIKIGDIRGDADHLLNILEATRDFTVDEINKLTTLTNTLVGKLFTQKGEFRKILLKYIDSEIDDLVPNYINKFNEIKGILDFSEFDEEQFQLGKIVFNILEDTYNRYTKEKQSLSALDFNDLIELAEKLLDNPEVREKVSSRIEYLLVDEFQDTDELQYSIIKKIIGEFNGTGKQNNLFIVGDAKQSIYGFRNADVQVFRRAIEDIYQINKVKFDRGEISNLFYTGEGDKTPSEEDFIFGKMNLTSTFRLKPDIAAFVNYVCDEVFLSDSTEFDVPYEPLVAARNAEVHSITEKNSEEYKQGVGKVSLLISVKEKKTDEAVKTLTNDFDILEQDIDTIPEEEMIAQFIKQKCNSGEFKLKDFGILSRNKKKFDLLVKSLISNGIPYVNHSGAGFYQAQEVKDIIALLKFVVNPADDISLLSVLKSSICGFTDAELYMLSQQTELPTYWERLAHFKNLSIENTTEAKTKRFIVKADNYYVKLKDLIDNKLNMSVPVLIMRAVESFSWYAVIAKSPYKFRIESNIDKFVDFSREFINRGFKNIFDFIEELNFIEENGISEREAAQITDAEAVNLMTIHASKGLEFPIVILMGTNFKSPDKNNAYFDLETGFNFIFRTERDNVYLDSVHSGFYKYNKFKQKQKEAAEEKRILYVALTRAKDELVITATVNNTNSGISVKKGSFLEMLSKTFDFKEAIENGKNHINYFTELDILENYLKKQVKYNSVLHIVSSVNNMPEPLTMKSIEAESIQDRRFLLAPLKGGIDGEFLSASRLMSFINNKDEYLKKYILGIPQIDLNESQTEKDEDEYAAISAMNFGTAVHYAMEHINHWFDGNIVDHAKLNYYAEQALNNYYQRDEETFKLLVKLSENITKTRLMSEYTPMLKEALQEFSLFLPIGTDFIQGTIDFIITNRDNEYEVWDWKTNRIHNNLIETAHHYEMQMKLYAYFIYRSFPGQKLYKSRLIFARLAAENIADDEWTYTYVWTEQDMTAFEIELLEIVKQAKNYPFLE